MTALIIIAVLLLTIIFLLYKLRGKSTGCGCRADRIHTEHHEHQTGSGGDGTIDPVYGMTVDPESDLASEYQGKSYLFCSESCRDSFVAEPGKYIK